MTLIFRPARAARPAQIPADAGLPSCSPPSRAGRWVYPRECGATGRLPLDQAVTQGLSPRVRGYPGGLLLRQAGGRSIPAGAGLPAAARNGSETGEVYPRGCGVTSGPFGRIEEAVGLSPRVRGYQLDPGRRQLRGGSIPTSAGLPLRHFVTQGNEKSPPTAGQSAGQRCGGLKTFVRIDTHQYSKSAPRGVKGKRRRTRKSSIDPTAA